MEQAQSTRPGLRSNIQTSLSTPEAGEVLKQRQAELGAEYRTSPTAAEITDHAQTAAANLPGDGPLDPLHTRVLIGKGHDMTLPIGLHPAVGGPGDLPVPGDLLCAALAACTDSTIRVVANVLGVDLLELAVDVTADVDVRGTLCLSADVPVAFQAMRVHVRLRASEATPPDRLKRLVQTAEHCCVVMRTLRDGVPIEVQCDHGESR